MYPASLWGSRSHRRSSAAQLVSLLAVLILLYAGLFTLFDMAPGPGHVVAFGSTPPWVCRAIERNFAAGGLGGGQSSGGGAQIHCRYVPADPRIPLRVGVGLAALLAASTLFIAASRLTRVRPALA